MLNLETNIPLPQETNAGRPTKYEFEKIKPGMSVWCATSTDRNRIYAAFNHWRHRARSSLKAYTRGVNENDPRGQGFRIWFMEGGDGAE